MSSAESFYLACSLLERDMWSVGKHLIKHVIQKIMVNKNISIKISHFIVLNVWLSLNLQDPYLPTIIIPST